MKKLLFYFLAPAALVSCQKADVVKAPADAKALPDAYPQTWQLVKLTGQIPGYVKTGADLPWQETYVLQADGTFAKKRQQGNQFVEARGTFAVQPLSDGPYLVLAYGAATPLIGSCTPTTWTETLAVKVDGTLESTWRACDGPGLEYKQVNLAPTAEKGP